MGGGGVQIVLFVVTDPQQVSRPAYAERSLMLGSHIQIIAGIRCRLMQMTLKVMNGRQRKQDPQEVGSVQRLIAVEFLLDALRCSLEVSRHLTGHAREK